MTHQVKLLRRAAADIDEKFESIRRHLGRRAALRWRGQLGAHFTALEDRPDMWPVADEADDLGMDLRALLHGRRPHVYRILFTVEGQEVHVHRVRHAARDRLAPGAV